jgi:hypothetical protein
MNEEAENMKRKEEISTEEQKGWFVIKLVSLLGESMMDSIIQKSGCSL